LLSSLIAAWPERPGRTCFLVGDPMQSIYSFREADAELFPRVKTLGLVIPNEAPLRFDSVSLTANFRTTPALVERLNQDFERVFAVDDGSGISFTSAQPARDVVPQAASPFTLHLDFIPPTDGNSSADVEDAQEAVRARQLDAIVYLIHSYTDRIEAAKASGTNFRVAVLGRAKKHLAPIAAALRDAGIPFRSVELENLATRPEVLDALALARALLNPEDRVAWLGVLRAPWCGLSLDDLHTLVGPDEETRTGLVYGPDGKTYRPSVREMLSKKQNSLSEDGKSAVSRLLQALDSAPNLHAGQSPKTLGTWLDEIWLRLGGAACVDATAQANLNFFWSFLDRLPNGEEDLFSPGLNAALSQLTALPDPEAASASSVQLMTIHKAKGLEAKAGSTSRKMLSWLERGLLQPTDTEEITEFLIAPFQRKGAERSSAKAWVDCIDRERELQETRRVLYVASTRAREELHLFARPNYKEIKGEYILAAKSGSLLSAAWPALEDEIQTRFEDWNSFRINPETHEEQITSIAASGESNLLTMPSPVRPTLLRRLPSNYPLSSFNFPSQIEHKSLVIETSRSSFYTRHEGGLHSRVLGTAVHSLLEELARQRKDHDWNFVRNALQSQAPRLTAHARAAGLDETHAERIAEEAIAAALSASRDPVGAWILSPHPMASSEVSWAGVTAGGVRSVRVDRLFRAGPAPCAEGEDCWWIIDYKTAHANNPDPESVRHQLHELFAPQVEAYAALLRNLHGAEAPIFAGLYYPRMLLLDWWQL
jgi:ATP-dependent exoDNAse (exonuclease V) beta subunit